MPSTPEYLQSGIRVGLTVVAAEERVISAMELRHLKYFIAVADELHFGRAAARVRVAQPALSAQIRTLEEELEVRLFDRDKRRVLLTPAGSAFLKEARATIQQAERASTTARLASQGVYGKLLLGCITSFREEPLTSVIREYRKDFPAVELQFMERTPAGLERALLDEEVDLAFLRPPVCDAALEARVVEQAEMVVVLPKDHALTEFQELSWKQLAEESFIQLPDEESPGFNSRLREHAFKAGFIPQVRHACKEMHSILWLVSLGMGISIMVMGMRQLLPVGLEFRRFKAPRPKIQTLMTWRRNDGSPALLEFVRRMSLQSPDMERSIASDNI